ncbi:hypothetical protein JMF97_13115 [Micromonospora fiedleri]|uniref:Uncharacterized protein n=1 Tax=Micromonospora fiedleri TaxID=1157498 RepID=A0ABS1UL73_9ACTN|nr:hypothetical protein [Micromonospora fiedleri]MBL6277099.1 hypothetical protein [Micromonospora fiedleri]
MASAVAGVLLVSALTACAPPDSAPSTGPARPTVPASPAASATPIVEARCAAAAGTPPEVVAKPTGTVTSPGAPEAVGSGHPMTDEQLRQEEFLRQQAANKAFRQRGTLDPAAAGGAHACAAEVQRVLNLLTVGGQDAPEEEAVRQAVAGTGLLDVVVRPPGRLDLGPGDGLIFSGWTGRAMRLRQRPSGRHHRGIRHPHRRRRLPPRPRLTGPRSESGAGWRRRFAETAGFGAVGYHCFGVTESITALATAVGRLAAVVSRLVGKRWWSAGWRSGPGLL